MYTIKATASFALPTLCRWQCSSQPLAVRTPSQNECRGGYANEQELVSDILRVAVPVLEQYQQLRRDVQASLDEVEQGKVRDADFDAVREQLRKEYDESGNRK